MNHAIFDGYTDADNAYRFINNAQDQVRYVPAWGGWMVWDGKRWKRDEGKQVKQLWLQSAQELHAIANQYRDKKMRQHANRAANRGGVEACLSLAETDPRVITDPKDWDANHWVLNVGNGLVDLTTGELRAHDASQLITKLTDIEYDAEAQCQLFERTIAEIFDGNQALVQFVQRVFGVCLTGVTRDQAVYFLYGLGANGKSTLLKVLEELLGEYHKTASQSAFVEERSDNNTYDALAGLHGARAVTCTEPGRTRALNEAVIKRISGSDQISARFLHGHFFAYHPTFKALIAVNHQPRVYGTDRGIWRRLKMIPFKISFEGREDKDLPAKLVAELPGILNWAIRGCLAWQEQGLNPPAEVLVATEDYRKEMDDLAPWLDEMCYIGPGNDSKSADLYKAYKEWYEEQGAKEKPMSTSDFSKALSERGFQKQRERKGIKWLGIRAKSDDEVAEEERAARDAADQEAFLTPPQSEFLDEPDEPTED